MPDKSFITSDFLTAKNVFTAKPYNMEGLDSQYVKSMVAKELDIESEKLYFPGQTGSDNVGVVQEDSNQNFFNTDALISNCPNIAVGVYTADCVPILLHDEKSNAIAAVHAGWRGSLNRIVEKTILRMINEFGSNPENIKAVIGPSISQDFYEVGKDLYDMFNDNQHPVNLIFVLKNRSKYLLDLWKCNKLQLKNMGLPDGNIKIMGMCTYKQAEMFFSARREGEETGRQAAIIKN